MTPVLREKILAFANNDETFAIDIGVRAIDVGDGTATVTLTHSEKNRNHWNAIHGGALFTLCDVACGTALLTLRQEHFVTINSTVDFLSPGTGMVTATATVDRMGGKLCFCSAKVHDETGKLVANMHSVWSLTGKPLEL